MSMRAEAARPQRCGATAGSCAAGKRARATAAAAALSSAAGRPRGHCCCCCSRLEILEIAPEIGPEIGREVARARPTGRLGWSAASAASGCRRSLAWTGYSIPQHAGLGGWAAPAHRHARSRRPHASAPAPQGWRWRCRCRRARLSARRRAPRCRRRRCAWVAEGGRVGRLWSVATLSTLGRGWAPIGSASPPGSVEPPRAARRALVRRRRRARALQSGACGHAAVRVVQVEVAKVEAHGCVEQEEGVLGTSWRLETVELATLEAATLSTRGGGRVPL